jgi:hypothetical protein
MKHVLPLVLGLLLAVPAAAQAGKGSINQGAPTVNQTVNAGDAKISLNYTSINFGKGAAMTRLMDKDKGGKARESVNNQAKAQPMGTFSTSVALTCGDVKIPAGEYKLGFTINDNLEWQMSLMGTETINIKLALMDNKAMPHKRLLCSLFAGDENGAGCYVAFGDKNCVLSFSTAAAGGEKKG